MPQGSVEGFGKRRNEVGEVSGLVGQERIDWRLAMLGGDNEQCGIVDASVLQTPDHGPKSVVDLLQNNCYGTANAAWRTGK